MKAENLTIEVKANIASAEKKLKNLQGALEKTTNAFKELNNVISNIQPIQMEVSITQKKKNWIQKLFKK